MKRAFVFLAILLSFSFPAMAVPAKEPGLTYAAARAKVIAEGYRPLPWRNGKLEHCNVVGAPGLCLFAFERPSDDTYKLIQVQKKRGSNSREVEITDVGYRSIEQTQTPSGLGNYPQVRAKLIARGYKPLKFQHGELEYLCQGICDRYPEMLHCFGTGMGRCSFIFFRPSDGRYRRVVTVGEAPMAERPVDDIGGLAPFTEEEVQERLKRRYYPGVRAALAKQGYKPLALKETDYKSCPERICERYSEVLTCPAGPDGPCQFVFWRASDRSYRVVQVERIDAIERQRVWDLAVTGSAPPTPAQLKAIAARR